MEGETAMTNELDTLKAISELSNAIGFMQHEQNRCASPGLAANIAGLVEVREFIRCIHEKAEQENREGAKSDE
jgi:hypothetical protein